MNPRRGMAIFAASGLLLCGLVAAQETPPSTSSSSSAQLKLASGMVTSVSDHKLVVRTSDGDEMTFDLNSLTTRPATLRVGDRVQIDYEDGWTSDTAKRITAMSGGAAMASSSTSAPAQGSGMHGSSGTATQPASTSASATPRSGSTSQSTAPPSSRANDGRFEPLNGTLVSLHDDRVVVRAPSGEHETFLLDPGQRDRITVQTGDWVAVDFEERSGQRYATSVRFSPGERGFDASIGDYRNQQQYRASNQPSDQRNDGSSQASSYSSGQASGQASSRAASEPIAAGQRRTELPQTASRLPLLALAGLLALAAAGVFHQLRIRT